MAAQRYFGGKGEKIIVEMLYCPLIIVTIFSHVLPSILVFLYLLLFNSYISQTPVFIPKHSNTIISALRAGIVLLFFVFAIMSRMYKAVNKQLVVFEISTFMKC